MCSSNYRTPQRAQKIRFKLKLNLNVTIVDTLIALVEERPTIWDKRSKTHSSRIAVEKCWKEIGAALEVDENALRKKWKYLRDQFCVELGKVQTSTGPTKWRHFNALEFLKETVNPRVYGKDDEYDGRDDSDLELDDQSSSDYFERLSSKSEGKKKIKKETRKKNKTALKRSSVPDVQDNDSVHEKLLPEDEDEHLYFFKSIHPHVRKIPESKLLSFRSRIQCLVEEFAYGTTSTSAEFIPEFPIKGSPLRYSSEACDPIDTSG